MISYPILLEKFQTILKQNSLKFTKQRELILKYLYENDGHFTPEDIYISLKDIYPNIKVGLATVYRTLTLLETSSIVSSISFGVQGKRYELGLKKHHDHLICTKCGNITEFFDDIIEDRQKYIAKKFNFEMKDHTMKIVGLCQDCKL